MIDPAAFKAGMLALCEAHGRKATVELCRVYEGVLSPKLTTEEWSYACHVVLERDRFWPPPSVLLDAVARRREITGGSEPEAWQLESIERRRRIAERSESERARKDGRLPL